MILTIRPATLAEAEWMGRHLRLEDEREVETGTGMAADIAVPQAYCCSTDCYTIRLTDRAGKIEEHPTVIFGITDDPNDSELGIIWLLATDNLRRGSISVLREAGFWINHFCRSYANGVHNIVDTRNDLHVRWLKLMGFTFGSEVSIRGVPFVHFWRQ